MIKILKKLSLIIVILMSFSILFVNNVFADMMIDTPVSHTSDYTGVVIFAIILALLIGFAIMIVISDKKYEKKINETENLNINNDKDDSQND